MKIVIDIPEEQVKKSLEESKYINEDEGEKGSVHIAMLYTNAQIEFVDVERKTDFYSCKYKILPEHHGRLGDLDALEEYFKGVRKQLKASDYKNGTEFFVRDEMLLNVQQFIHLCDAIIEGSDSE